MTTIVSTDVLRAVWRDVVDTRNRLDGFARLLQDVIVEAERQAPSTTPKHESTGEARPR